MLLLPDKCPGEGEEPALS